MKHTTFELLATVLLTIALVSVILLALETGYS